MIKVKIEYNHKSTLLLCDENIKCLTLFRKYVLLENLNYDIIYFTGEGECLSTKENKRKKLKEIYNTENEDKYTKIHSIVVNENEFERSKSDASTASMAIDDFKEKIFEFEGDEDQFDDINNLSTVSDFNELIDELKNIKILSEGDKIVNDEGNKILNNKIDAKINIAIKQKYFSIIKLYLIFLIQYILVSLLYGIFFSNDLSDKLKNFNETFIIIFIFLLLVIMIGISTSIFFIPKPYLTQKFKIISIFFIINTLCLLFTFFLLTKYLDYKYILISLILEIIIALSMELYIVIKYNKDCKKYIDFSFNKYYFILIPFIPNLLAIILIYYVEIKDIYKIIYISIISIILNIIHFFITYFKFKNYKMKEYILTSFCISLTIFYLIGKGINKCYKNIKSQFIHHHGVDVKVYILKIYSIILIEFTSIVLLVFLVFFYNLNEIFVNNPLYFFIPCVAILIIVYILKFFRLKVFLYASIILFIPVFIIFLFLISYLIKDKNLILCSLSLIYLDIISMEFYALFCKIYDQLGMIISPIIINAISLPFFYFFWIKDVGYIIGISTFALIILIFNFFILKKLFLFINDDFRETSKYVIYINLSVLYSIDMIIHTIKLKINYMNLNDHNTKSILSLKINSVLLLYLVILIIINKIFPRYINDFEIYLSLGMNLFIFISGLFAIYIYYACCFSSEIERKKSKCIFFISNIFYIVLATFIITFIPYEQVLVALLLLLIDIIAMEFYSLFTDNFSCYFFVLFSFIFHGILTLIIHLNFNISYFLTISGITLGYLVYVIIIELLLLNKIEIYEDEGCYSISLLNYIKCLLSGIYCEIILFFMYYFYYKPFQIICCRDFHCDCQCCADYCQPLNLCWCERLNCCCFISCY